MRGPRCRRLHAQEDAAFERLDLALVTETYPPEINGVARSLHRLVDEVALAGHRIEVVRPRQRSEPAGGNHPGATGVRERLVRGARLPRYPDLQFGLPCGRALRRAWTASRPAVVHVATEGPLGLSAIRAARSLGIPVTSSFHTNFHTYGRHYGLGALTRIGLAYLRWVHHRTRATFVPSRTIRETLAAQGFRDLALLGRGVDAELFRPDRRDPALRRSWGAENGTPVLCHVGRLAAEKNLDLVVRAAEAIRRVRPEAILVLVGDGPMRARLERRHPWVRFAGMRRGEDLARHYASADLFLFPSTTETFGNVVPEALASGLVVVAYDYAAAREHVVDGVNGVTVPFDESGAFARAAVATVERIETWPALRERARATAERLGWAAVAAGWVSDLRAVVASRAHGAVTAPAEGVG